MAKWYEAQIGPLPAYAWVGALLGAVAIVLYDRHKKAQQAAAAPATTASTAAIVPSAIDPTTGLPYSAEAAAGGGTIGFGSVVQLPNGAAIGQYPSTVLNPEPQFTTNSDWETYGQSWAIAHGLDPALTSQALSAYLDGGTPTAQEQGIIETVLTGIGPPPIPPPAMQPATPPVTYTPPTGETLFPGGAGYWNPGSPNAPVTDAAGNSYLGIVSAAQAVAILNTGTPIYFQSAPGVFQTIPNVAALQALDATGLTPIYQRVSGAPASATAA